jgi:hypothetical protein
MSKCVPSRDDHTGEQTTRIPKTTLMSGAQANTGGRIDAAQSSSPPLPFFCFEAYLSCLTTHASSSSTGIGSCESTFFSSVPNGPLTHSHVYAHYDVCFLVTLTQSLLSCQLHSYDSTAWCANLNCVHSSISFYRRTSKCSRLHYRSDRAAPDLILRSSVHVSPQCCYWPPTLTVSRPGAQTNCDQSWRVQAYISWVLRTYTYGVCVHQVL